MKKIILLALIASSAVFAIEAADMAKEAAVAKATSEVKAAVASESNTSEEAVEKAAEKETM